MAAQHTPAPWELGDVRQGSRWVNAHHGEHPWSGLAEVVVEVDGAPNPEAEANARLIIAAPYLLAACKEVLRCAALPDSWAEPVRAAIAKAEAAQC